MHLVHVNEPAVDRTNEFVLQLDRYAYTVVFAKRNHGIFYLGKMVEVLWGKRGVKYVVTT